MATLSVPISRGRESGAIDIKSGEICLIEEKEGLVQKHKLYMKVIKNDYEHHVQLYTDAGYMSLKGTLSMRNRSIAADEQLRRITIDCRNMPVRAASIMERKSMSFEVNSSEEFLDWVESLTPAPNLAEGSVFSPQVSPVSPKRKKLGQT